MTKKIINGNYTIDENGVVRGKAGKPLKVIRNKNGTRSVALRLNCINDKGEILGKYDKTVTVENLLQEYFPQKFERNLDNEDIKDLLVELIDEVKALRKEFS